MGKFQPGFPLRILVVVGDAALRARWADHLAAAGMWVDAVESETGASRALFVQGYNAIILDIDECVGSALAIADLAGYRAPDVPVIAVSHGAHFTDGSVFSLIGNACTQVTPDIPTEDLAGLIEHYAVAGTVARA